MPRRGFRFSLCIVLTLAGPAQPALARRVHEVAARPTVDQERPAGEDGFGRALSRLSADRELDLTAAASRLDLLLLADAADGRLDQHSLLAASLVANGVEDPAVLRQYETRLDGWCDEILSIAPRGAAPADQARAVLEFLHRRVFTGGYEVACTDLPTTLETGRYNCVSSTVLFNALADRLGLSAVAVECPAHVYSRLVLPGQSVDVEATCAGWFDLPPERRRAGAPGSQEAGPDARPTEDQRERPIGPVELVAIVYYNRGVDQIERREFREALASNQKALRLDPHNAAARANLLAALNNWALAESGSGEFARAVHLLETGLTLAPAQHMFRVNYLAVHQQWVERLLASGSRDEALEVLARASRRLPDEDLFHRAARDIRNGN